MTPDFDDAFDARDGIRDGENQLILDLEGYEGPIDVLLSLARDQKVDLTKISILELADQYLEFVARARQLSLELAADYLVMAAWLAYLKSRLLLPDMEGEDEPTGAQLAAALAFQLQRLEAMQKVGATLLSRARLGREVFSRGAPEGLKIVHRPVIRVSLYDVLKAYANLGGAGRAGMLRIPPADLYSMDDAIKRLTGLLRHQIDWGTLSGFLPPDAGIGLRRRSAVASMLAASLELVRAGRAEIRQDESFGPVYLRRSSGES